MPGNLKRGDIKDGGCKNPKRQKMLPGQPTVSPVRMELTPVDLALAYIQGARFSIKDFEIGKHLGRGTLYIQLVDQKLCLLIPFYQFVPHLIVCSNDHQGSSVR